MICWRSSSGSRDIVKSFEAPAMVDTIMFWEGVERVECSSSMFWYHVRQCAGDSNRYKHLDWPKGRAMKVDQLCKLWQTNDCSTKFKAVLGS